MADVHHEMPELDAGSTLGPYELIATIGVGGMARVWAARVRGKQDIIALKVLLPELAENVEFRKMFFDEASIASRVRHPNVCSTYEMGEQGDTLYLAMELLDGPSLMRVLRPGPEDISDCERIPIQPRLAARIVADACAGLHAAHELVGNDGRPLAVVHRDVSPHNLLMTSAGEVKITDFGVAKALGKSHMTIAGQLKGKLAYMAPEQLSGGAVDRRCDVFALGCVLYEITTGQRPFQGEHDPQVMASIMMGRYEPPASIVPSYPHQLSIIVMRALANEPKGRYASADEMRRALEAYLQASGPPVGAAQIAALVRERCGQETAARAASLGGATAGMNGLRGAPGSAQASGGFETASGAMMLDGSTAPSRRPVLWMVAAALVGAALGLGVLSYVRASRKARAQPVAASSTATSAGSASAAATDAPPVIAAPSTGTVAAEGATTTAATAAAQGRVHLSISPSNAVVIVDGVVLPPGTDTLVKPQNGTTMNVLVRADKHEDTIVMLDSATPGEVEVTLIPDAAAAGTSSGGGAAPASTKPRVSHASAKDSGAGASGGDGVVSAPPNPYD